MKKPILSSLALCSVMLIGLPACNRAEAPSTVSADVADAQKDRAENVVDAKKDEAETYTDTATAAASRDPDNRGDAIEDRAEARFDTAVAQAKGDMDVAKQGCEALKGDAQSQCKKSADASYESAKSTAQLALETERKRSDATQKLDNK
jgi:hypothetical protein